MTEYMPYIVSIIIAIITGLLSYLTAVRKAGSEAVSHMKTLQESNKHDIEKLMQQHRLDLESLERKHQMEMEKLEAEHKHQTGLKDKEVAANLGSSLLGPLLSSAMNMPGVQEKLQKALDEQDIKQQNDEAPEIIT